MLHGCIISAIAISPFQKRRHLGFLRLLAVFFAPYAYASSGLDMEIKISGNIVFL
jgi:hypothetical protein